MAFQDGQAEQAPTTTDDLAQFLVDNPEADAKEDEPNADAPDDESDNADGDENPDEGQSPDDDADDEESPEAKPSKDQTSDAKVKITVKGDDGVEQEIELDKKEIAASYMRHSDYTRKAQELGDRERQAHEVVTRKLDQGRQHYMQEVGKAHAAIQHLTGLKSEQEMQELAVTDPSAWVRENQRMQAVRATLSTLEQNMALERQQAEQQAQQQSAQAIQQAWGVLGQQGIDKVKLQGIFEGVKKAYGVPEERFAQVNDPKLVLIMRDAMAYRELQDKAKASKAAKPAPAASKLPAPRQNVPQVERDKKQLNSKFRNGTAKTRDLASFILANEK